MKLFKALILAAVPWYPIALFVNEATNEEAFALFLASATSVTIFALAMKHLRGTVSGTGIASAVIGSAKGMRDAIEFSVEEKDADLYAQAEEEYESGEIDKGLWSQALVKAKGSENLRKIEYMKLRVKKLRRESNSSSKTTD